MKLHIANVVVVEAGAGLNTARALPVFNKQAAILFARNKIVAHFLACGTVHVPVANPEIKLPKLRGLARRRGLEKFLIFSVVAKLLELAGAGDVRAKTRRLAS